MPRIGSQARRYALNRRRMCDTPLRKMLRESYATSKVTLFRRFLRADPATTCSVILCLILATPLRAQERVRTSAGPLAIQTFKRAPEVFFRLGPFDGDVTASTGVEYTDNANLAPTDKVSRLRFDEGLDLDVTWVVSHLSELEVLFDGQLTEDFYGNGTKQANFEVTPSLIQYKFSISYFRIRLYDSFSYTNDPTSGSHRHKYYIPAQFDEYDRPQGRLGFRYSNPLAFS